MQNQNTNAVLTMMPSLTKLSNIYLDEDGFPRCTKCDTLRVTTKPVSIFGHTSLRIIPCECMLKSEELKKEEQRYSKKMDVLESLRSASLVGERYKNTTFDNTDTSNKAFADAFNKCKRYCSKHKEALQNGWGIYLSGTSGTGKTHLLACMCNDLLNNLQQCLFTNFFEISRSIRSSYRDGDSERVIKKVCEIDFLFIDDIGTEILKKNGDDIWLQEQVFDIINKRYNNRKPTIFSSNYTLKELVSERGMMEKTVDRIMEMATAVIRIDGSSIRFDNRNKQNARFKEASEDE